MTLVSTTILRINKGDPAAKTFLFLFHVSDIITFAWGEMIKKKMLVLFGYFFILF